MRKRRHMGHGKLGALASLPSDTLREPSSPHECARSPGIRFEPRSSRQVALRFRSIRGINKTIDAIWTDPRLRGLPFEFGRSLTMLVPEDAVELLRPRVPPFEVLMDGM